MGRESDTRSRQAWELAARQHGVVTRKQLLAIGFGRRSIQHRVERGRLFRVSPGIYAVGWPALNQKRRWMAAVLAGGEGAALSHRSAAVLWEIGDEKSERIIISVRRRCELQRSGIHFHGRPSLRPEEIVHRDDIPVTSPIQTLIDLATELPPIPLERAVNEADKRGLVDPETLREELARFRGEPGVRPLRRLLDKLFFRLSDSDLEISFRRIVKGANLSMPLSKQQVNRFEVDFFWPDLGLIVETDGLPYHRTPSAQTRDARRDRAHIMAGMTPLRFTHYEVRYEPTRVRSALSRTTTLLEQRIRL
ncbi:MAG TPA: type IV toxin-antitoxin system AbiEi family antitoxin domain-containing protein [Solirubrobacterales bacterium]|nr:type IV toxin-antitoxin system AbiEi family antitoxin domain-containing protein [Solirubrobacterales bacterium]